MSSHKSKVKTYLFSCDQTRPETTILIQIQANQ